MPRKLEPIVLELQRLVKMFVNEYPGYGGELADKLGVSRPAIARWAAGKNLPYPSMAKSRIAILRKLLKK